MTPSAPDVSVVIPAYAEPEYLREAAASVADQQDVEVELIVVDDGSPESLEPALADARRRLGDRLVFARQENAGGAAARNRGVELATAKWLAFLDHDDVWLADKLSRQLDAARLHPEAGLVYCAYQRFGDGARRGVHPTGAPSGDLVDALLEHTWIRTLSVVMVRRDALGDERWFDPAYRYADDIDLYFRLAERERAVFVPEALVRKRSHERQASRNALESHDEYVAIVERLRRRLGPDLGPARSGRIRRRLARHRRGAAKAALAQGDFQLSERRYRESLRLQPLRPGAWRGWIAARLAARRSGAGPRDEESPPRP